MKHNAINQIESSLSELIELLEPKLSYSKNALDYVKFGEYGIAIEFLADWCVDAEPQILLSAQELMMFKEIGKQMDIHGPWVELLPILIPSDVQSIPKEYAIQARNYIEKQQVKNPERKTWLNKIRSVINEIDNTI